MGSLYLGSDISAAGMSNPYLKRVCVNTLFVIIFLEAVSGNEEQKNGYIHLKIPGRSLLTEKELRGKK